MRQFLGKSVLLFKSDASLVERERNFTSELFAIVRIVSGSEAGNSELGNVFS